MNKYEFYLKGLVAVGVLALIAFIVLKDKDIKLAGLLIPLITVLFVQPKDQPSESTIEPSSEQGEQHG